MASRSGAGRCANAGLRAIAHSRIVGQSLKTLALHELTVHPGGEPLSTGGPAPAERKTLPCLAAASNTFDAYQAQTKTRVEGIAGRSTAREHRDAEYALNRAAGAWIHDVGISHTT